MKYPVISLFSGAMGLDLGLEAAGLDIRIAQDFDPWCVKTMINNGKNVVAGDIRDLIARDPECSFLLEPASLRRSDVFAVVGGPPCQPFSTAGKRLGTSDPRGSLFMEFHHVVKTIRPRFFVMENVKGLLSAAVSKPVDASTTNPVQQRGSALEIILDTFRSIGYKVTYGLLDAVHYGVPQFRERLVIIGSRDHEDIFLPVPTHFQRHQDPMHRWQTLRQAIGDLEHGPGPCATFSNERMAYLNMVPMGGNWKSLPSDLVREAMGGAYESGGGKVGFFRRLDYNQPSPTLVTSPVQKATMLCHPTQARPLSVREYARIQQFPDNWRIEGAVSDCYRQIGNAVPRGLGQAIGQTLVSIAEGSAEIRTRRLRGTSIHSAMLDVQNYVAGSSE